MSEREEGTSPEEWAILSNVGHRCISNAVLECPEILADALRISDDASETTATAESQIVTLSRILLATAVPYGAHLEGLVHLGMVERVPKGEFRGYDDVRTRYKRNPLENVTGAIIEFTSRCGFHCGHCYNARVPRVPAETTKRDHVPALIRAVDGLVKIGVDGFKFIGGEVLQFGDGWLQVAKHIASLRGGVRFGSAVPLQLPVLVLTSGWFLLEKGPFLAAGVRYSDADALLADLKRNGVTHVGFSLDGHTAEAHDSNRGVDGLFDAIVNRGIAAVHRAGMQPRVSLLLAHGDLSSLEFLRFATRLADAIYLHDPPLMATECTDEGCSTKGAEEICSDLTNTMSNFIDIGAGAKAKCCDSPEAKVDLLLAPEELLRCKGYFRPAPFITIKGNGEVALCRVTSAGEGYGNVNHRDIVDILNHLQDNFIFRLHAEGRLGEYVKFVDTSIFGRKFAHMCTARAVVTMIACRMHDRGVKADDKQAIKRINSEIAWLTGHSATQQQW